MSETAGTTSAEDGTCKQSRNLRRLGLSVLVVGLVTAGIVYWLGTSQRDFSDDPSMAGFDKASTRQMEMLYGKTGVMMDDLVGAFKRPAVQSGLIIGVAALFCLICFHRARPADSL
jgi:hypothetical protein